jgi:8-oxo-dGTP diphosphatase
LEYQVTILKENTPVIAAVINKNSTYLVCRRPSIKRHGGLWEFPGGKIKEGESYLDAARRELSEELNVVVISVGRLLFKAMDPDSPFLIEFVDVGIVGEPEAIEHSEFRWCKVDEFKKLPLVCFSLSTLTPTRFRRCFFDLS